MLPKKKQSLKTEIMKNLKEQTPSFEAIQKFILKKPKHQLVASILNDAIIFARISNQMNGILNALAPNDGEQEFFVEGGYAGVNNATKFLKVKDTVLDRLLVNIFCDMVYENNTKTGVDDLADLMCYRWLKTIKKYNSSI